MLKRVAVVFAALAGAAWPAAFAAAPPQRINYQGVLRNASDQPLTASYDMVFSFWDAPLGGNEILDDSHLAAGTGAVSVSNGLFNAALGGGAVTDGPGAGTYTALDQVFRDYSSVWLQVKVGSEVLSPRTPVIAAAYALNATNLNGQPSSSFLDTSGARQVKTGELDVTTTTGNVTLGQSGASVVGATTISGTTGVDGTATAAATNGYGVSGYCYGVACYGVYGQANGTSSTGVEGDGSLYGVIGGGTDAGSTGVFGIGHLRGGYFSCNGASATADVANGNTGLTGRGNFAGGYFLNGTTSNAYAYLAYNGTGIAAYATSSGENPAYFNSTYNGNWASVGQNTTKVTGNGSMGFVQNHPEDPSREVVYMAPEGDEVAVYTRGSARLVNGEARVALGPTFRWVTNPDVGLTATVTPRGDAIPLAVVSVSPSELTVRGPAGATAPFDYLVYGLRIGFEERPVIRPKTHESPIPGKAQDEELFAAHPELRAYTALARHAAMRGVSAAPIDFSSSNALERSIGVGGRPGVAIEVGPRADRVTPDEKESTAPQASKAVPPLPLRSSPETLSPATVVNAPAQAPAATWPVSEHVEAGDLLVFDPVRPGELRRSMAPSDTNVAGIAAADATTADGSYRVALVDTLYPIVKADATLASIHPGDLLVSGNAEGLVMRAPDGSTFAAIVGKAMQGLDAGIGRITIARTTR